MVADKFMPQMHLRQPGFTYSACGPSTKIKKEYKSSNKREIQDVFRIYKNELDKAYFQHDMAYEDFIDLKRRTAANNVLKIPNMMDIKEG